MKYFLFINCLFLSLSAFSQRYTKPNVFSLPSLSLDSNTTWTGKVFNDSINDSVRIVGLGEFTHGGEETTLFKAKMIQYLVKEKGYRQLLLEYPDVILRPIDDFLQRSDLTSLDSMRVIIQKTFARTLLDNRSFCDLIIWLKKYNLEHPDHMVSVYGFDISGAATAFAGYFMNTFLIPADPSGAEEILSRWNVGPKDSIAATELKWFHNHQSDIKQRLSGSRYRVLVYDVKAAESELMRCALEKTNYYKASAFRDSSMMTNILSLNDKKTILWAHNIHITTASEAVSLGNYLKAAVGKYYYSILTDFAREAMTWCISADGKLSRKTFTANNKTAAYKLRKKQGEANRVVFFTGLKSGQTLINNVDRGGNQFVIGKGRPFDALVIFDTVTPFSFN